MNDFNHIPFEDALREICTKFSQYSHKSLFNLKELIELRWIEIISLKYLEHRPVQGKEVSEAPLVLGNNNL